MNYVFKLATEEQIGIDSFGVPLYTVGTYSSREAALADWEKLTPEALAEVSIEEVGTGTVVAAFRNVVLDAAVFNGSPDLIAAQFHFHGEAVNGSSAEDADYIEAAKILLGEEE